MIIRYHQTYLSTSPSPFSISSEVSCSLNPKIQQLHTVLRAVYLLHRCCSLSNILPLMLKTHTVHFILRHETAEIYPDCTCIQIHNNSLLYVTSILPLLQDMRLSLDSLLRSPLCLCLHWAAGPLFV